MKPHSAVSYIVGFSSAVVLTLMSYLSVVMHWFSGVQLVAVIMGLATVQLVVQLVFFLHLGREKKPRWNLTVFIFMLIILVIIVGGSLWIMQNLNYHTTMSPYETNQYMLKQGSKGF